MCRGDERGGREQLERGFIRDPLCGSYFYIHSYPHAQVPSSRGTGPASRRLIRVTSALDDCAWIWWLEPGEILPEVQEPRHFSCRACGG